jgi:ABC-type transporter MlaC component
MHRSRFVCLVLFCASFAFSLPTVRAATPSAAPPSAGPAVERTLKTLIGAIRYDKDDLAIKQLDIQAMADALLVGAPTPLTPAQRQTFAANFDQLLRQISFAKGRELFKYLDAVLYGPPQAHGDRVHCRCTVVVHRELKKQEILIEWVLMERAGKFVVVDMISGGESTLEAIRTDQVLPLLKEGGAEALLAAMRKQGATSQ